MSNIAVFCGAREVNQIYLSEAFEFGKTLATGGHTLVYGGGTFGLMGAVYRGVTSMNGKTIGIIPDFLMSKERGDTLRSSGTELIVVGTMDERKKILFDRSDTVIMLPGGVGTLDEFFEAMSLVQLKQRSHKLAILNTNGFYDFTLKQIEKMQGEGFVPLESYKNLVIESSIEKLFQSLGL